MHLPTLLAMPEMQVAWLMDIDLQKAKRVGSSFEVPAMPLPADPGNAPHADIVLLAVPYGVREPYYEAFRQRQQALYIEKPLARTVQQHQRYCSWFARSQIAVGFQRRAWGAVRLLQQALESEAFGQLRRLSVQHGRPGQLTGSSYSGDFRLAGGGMLFEVGIHWVDLALFAAGAKSAHLDVGRMIRRNTFDLHTEARFTIQTGVGKAATLDLLVSGLCQTRNGLEFECDHATLFLSQVDGRISVEKAGVPLGIELTGRRASYPWSPFQMCHSVWKGLVQSLQTNSPNWTSASESLLTTQIIEDAYGLAS